MEYFIALIVIIFMMFSAYIYAEGEDNYNQFSTQKGMFCPKVDPMAKRIKTIYKPIVEELFSKEKNRYYYVRYCIIFNYKREIIAYRMIGNLKESNPCEIKVHSILKRVNWSTVSLHENTFLDRIRNNEDLAKAHENKELYFVVIEDFSTVQNTITKYIPKNK